MLFLLKLKLVLVVVIYLLVNNLFFHHHDYLYYHLRSSLLFFAADLVFFLLSLRALSRALAGFLDGSTGEIGSADRKSRLATIYSLDSRTDITITVFFGIGVIYTAIGMESALLSALGGIHGAEDGRVSVSLSRLQHLGTVEPRARAKPPLIGVPGEDLMSCDQLALEALRRQLDAGLLTRQVVSDLVSFVQNAPKNCLVSGDAIGYEKEGGSRAVPLEDIEDPGRRRRIGSVVDGQRDRGPIGLDEVQDFR